MAISKKAAHRAHRVLAGDIGGTKTFLGLFDIVEDRLELAREGAFENTRFGGIDEVISGFLKKDGGSGIAAASFGIAGPVIENRSTLTNLPWVIDGSEISKRFGIKKLGLMNDLVATAWSVDVLSGDDISTLQAGRKKAGNSALIAAGTGLGEAVLFWDGTTHTPSGSEGGHADFAPRNDVEIELLEYLMGFWDHVSYERVLSGPGLVTVYNFFKDKRGGKEPAYLTERIREEGAAPAISEEAIAGKDENCRDAMELFVSIYGAEAGNLALKSMAVDGVYIGGGIAPKIIKALEGGLFIESFRQKGRFEELLSEIPVNVILNEKAGLQGAAVYAASISEGRGKRRVKKIICNNDRLPAAGLS